MAIVGINTGSGFNTYTPGGGIGGLGQESVNSTAGKQDFRGRGVSGTGNSLNAGQVSQENQIAVSPDGDTVQISPQAAAKFDAAMKQIENGTEDTDDAEIKLPGDENKADRVELKMEQAENARKAARLKAERRAEVLKETAENIQKKEISEEKQSVSFAGKSDSDIKLLYLEGEISKTDYDSEMSSREKLRTQVTKKDNDFVKAASEGDSISKKLERFAESIKSAFSETTSKTFDAGIRLDAINIAEGDKKAVKETSNSDKKEVKISYS